MLLSVAWLIMTSFQFFRYLYVYPQDDTATSDWHNALFYAMGKREKSPPVATMHPSHIAGIDIPDSLSSQFQWISLLPNNHWLPYMRFDGKSSAGEIALLQHLLYQPLQQYKFRSSVPMSADMERIALLVSEGREIQSQPFEQPFVADIQTDADLPSVDTLCRIAAAEWQENTARGQIPNSYEHSEHRQDSDTGRRWLPASLRNRLLFFTTSTRSTHKHSINFYVWSLIRNWITKVQANEIEAHIRQPKEKIIWGAPITA